VQEPHKGCLGRLALRWRSGGARRRSIDTLRCRPVPRAIASSGQARERSLGEVRARSPRTNPRGAKPRGGAGGYRLKTLFGCKAVPGGMNPETEARRADLALWRRKNRWANGRWVLPSRNAGETSRERKPPKGKSQERRRCETKPARDLREQAAKRVTKP